MINPVSGRWVGGVDDEGQVDDDSAPDTTPPQRIVPYVEDRRNVLIVRPLELVEAATIATLQYALKRGIEAVYQLEESELMAEPLPGRDTCLSILFYESAEGGAGVLTRLATEPNSLAVVADKALEVMHYIRPENGRWDVATLRQELDEEGKPICEAGCYKCLLSYYNQPDHDVIDRQDPENKGKVLEILCRLTRMTAKVCTFGRGPTVHPDALRRISGSSLERAWLDHVEKHGYAKPDRAQETIERCQTCAAFYYADWKAAIYIDGSHHEIPTQQVKDANINACLMDAGYHVIRFPKEQSRWPEVFKAHADLFGTGK
jgi:very-short-patch-repair endonuclease